MKKFKCEYCEARPTTTYGGELLCNRHYSVLYGKPILNVEKIDVPKTSKERMLHGHYMSILSNFNFVDARKTKKIIKQFKNDIKTINNEIYFKRITT